MAAILCSSISDLITKGCKSLSTVICLPCKALNLGCESLGEILCSPFMPFIITTFALHTPGVVYGVMSLDNYGCPDLFRWLIVNAIFSGIHMIACLYIVQKLRESAPDESFLGTSSTNNNNNTSSKMEEGGAPSGGYVLGNFSVINDKKEDRNVGGAHSFQRVKHVLCYDVGVAVYIVLLIIWMVWIGMGISRRLTFDGSVEACDELVKYMNVTISCGYMWLMMVGVAFCCSFLCLR